MNILEPETNSSLRIAEIAADELRSLARDFIADIFDSRLTGIIVHAAFPASSVARVVERLESGACSGIEHASKFWWGRTFGPSLQHSASDLREYFDEVHAFRSSCAALFDGGPDFQARIDDLLTHAHAGRPLSTLRGPMGESYAAATIRGLVPGSVMHAHCDIEQFKLPAIRHLASQLDASSLLSYFVLLAAPDLGGTLHVYALRYDDERGQVFARMDGTSEDELRAIASHGELVLPMSPGDLLVFNAGYHFHRVEHVGGARTRWTQGGFLSRSSDGASVFYWH